MQVFRYEDVYRVALVFPFSLRVSLRFPRSYNRLIERLLIHIWDKRFKKQQTKRNGKYSRFKQNVFALWDFKCAKCGKPMEEVRLNVHHFWSSMDGPDFRLDPDAAAPLCCNSYGEGCHTDFHKKYGYKDFTPEDFFEFIQS